MKVILKDNIKGVGKKDEVINASDGYARNFLFPKNLAVEANAENMSKLKAKQNSTAFKKGQEKEEAEKAKAPQGGAGPGAGLEGRHCGAAFCFAAGLRRVYRI